MKKALQLSKLALLASLFCLNACNNDLVLVEGYKEIPIVYGFLTLADTATYIRVEKAYADPKRSATEVAQIPDSLYYADVMVTLVRVRNNERFALKKVDGNTEGYPRNGGTFAKSPNYLYKIKTSTLAMKADEDWRVEIARVADSKILAKATTRVIGDYSVFTPSVTPALFLTYDNTFTVGVETAEASAKIYAINIVFNYDETDPTKPNSTVSKSVKWQFSSSSSRTGSPAGGFDQQYFRRASKDFFEFLGTAILETAGLTRKFTSLDVAMPTVT